MRIPPSGERKLTELDYTRLHKLVADDIAPQLEDLLSEADVVPSRAVPPDIVTMYARCTVRDLKSRHGQQFVVCYPRDADPARGFISVLSPAGLALLGLPAGAIATWTAPGGEAIAVQIEEILFQPEASGDYLT